MTAPAVALAKPSLAVRNLTSTVRDHAAAMQRLQDQYFAALKRAEATYFDGVKRITEGLIHDTQAVAVEASAATPEAG